MSTPHATVLTVDATCDALRAAGLALDPADVRVERRDDRWAVTLPGDRMAWFPANASGRRQLAIERRVLRLFAERCTFGAPRILFESPDGFDVRAIVPGRTDPWGVFAEARQDATLARQLGHALGNILAEQHMRITRADVAGWLPERVSWPEPSDWIRERIVDVTDDRALIAAIDRMLNIYEQIEVDPADRVLVHADLGFHNVVVDPVSNDIRGVFDYSGAAWADRHHDLRYLVFCWPDEHVLEAALEVYRPAVARPLSSARIWLYNAVCGFSFLAYRRGQPAEAKWCGRTLAEDLAWARCALERYERFAATARD
jgi:aminoglycoside phosphotransferase (APT) family kinase protein